MSIETDLAELKENLAWYNGEICKMDAWHRHQLCSVDKADRVPTFVLAAVNEYINIFRQRVASVQHQIDLTDGFLNSKEVSHVKTE